jgi:phosphate transport system substrate-binding protein
MTRAAAISWFLLTGASAQVVDWVTPPLETHKAQTESEADFGRKNGRKLPAPELLQPMLDPRLPLYVMRKDVKVAGHYRAAASDVLPGLARSWIEAFRKYYPEFTVDLEPPYAGSLGADELVKGNLDMVFVSRELRPSDLTNFRAKFGHDPLSVPISGGTYRHFGFLDAVAFFVNRDNPIDKLSFAQLDAILSSTRHRGAAPANTWGDLGLTGEWGGKPIHVYGVQPWNGFEEFVRQRVLSIDGKRGEWRNGIEFDKVVFPVAGRVAQDKYGIGYAGIAYVDKPVKMLTLSASPDRPYVAPTYENVASAAWPLSRVVFLNLDKTPGQKLAPALEEFLKFILSREGQQLVLNQAIYLPLRSFQVESSRQLLTP